MQLFRSMSINKKLTLIIMSTTCIALLLAATAIVTSELIKARRKMVDNLATLSDVLGANSTAALSFNDEKAAEEILEALSMEPVVLSAFIFRTDGKLFARYLRDSHAGDEQIWEQDLNPSLKTNEGHSFDNDRLDLSRRIMLEGDTIGIVYLRSDLKTLYSSLIWYGTVVSAVMGLCILVAYIVSAVLKRSVSNPILSLTETMRKVSVEKNYAVRAKKYSDDEVGILIDGFNAMLEQIQTQEMELRRHGEVLEDEVRERTAELAQTNEELKKEIEERTRAEARLVQAFNTTKTILESMPFGVVIVGKDKKIRMANKASLELMKATSESDVIGKICHKNLCPADEGRCPVLDLGQEVDSSEKELVTSEGEELPILKTVVPIELQDEEVLLEAFVDISDLKKTQTALEEAKEKAETANRSKSQFLANMSHEIRTPMNGVLGMTELLLKTDLNDRQRRFLETVNRSGESLLDIINDILDFSKMEAGKLILERIGFDLHQVAEDVVEGHYPASQDKGLELACQIEHEVPRNVQGDPSRLRQILVNLVGNAVKFTEKGEVIVRVSMAKDSKKTVLIRFEVTDTGVGVELEAKDRIFEYFAQADGSMTRKFGGTGLGLSIAKQLARLMEGNIGIESTPGKGSTFWFTVQLEKQSASAEPLVTPSYDVQGIRTLLVDDNATNRDILREQCAGWGMVCESAENGHQALDMLRRAALRGEPHYLAILDMMMPGMDGMQLAEAIKADPAIANITLVILTSMGLRGDAEMARLAGVEAYLTKPVRQSELYNCIATVMGKTSQGASSQLVTRHSLAENQAKYYGRILVAEDTLLNQEVAREMLEAVGCHVDIVDNGLKAVEAVSSAQYDLIFMDCQMPKMNGYEATGVIRQKEKAESQGHHIPIVALTAHAMAGDRERCLAAGMDDYVIKPFKQKELGPVLERWLFEQPARSNHGTEPLHSAGGQFSEQPETASEDFSNQSPSDFGPIDPKALENIRAIQREGAPDIVAKLVNLYLEESPKFLQSLKDAIPSGDADAMQKAAHKFKSNSANVGAMGLAALCKELEEMGRANTTENTSEILAQVEVEYETAREALKQLL